MEEYEYIEVDMTPEEIAHAMVDGEIFYTFDGEFSFYWNSCSGFINNKGSNITLSGTFYKRIKKERKFNEGEWYPCVDRGGDRFIYQYSKGIFRLSENKNALFVLSPQSMKWIGESLGKIKFG